MGKVVRFASPRLVTLVEEPDRPLSAAEVRIRTRYSGISAGTELTAYRGSNPYLSRRWDIERRMFVLGGASFSYPLDGWGYEEVGQVVEVGPSADAALLGRMVWGTWGHRATHVAPASWAAVRLLPEHVDPLCGIFARMGAIALNGVHDAEVALGETIAVFGQGVPGLLVTQLCVLSGARVLAVDGLPDRLARARRYGATEAIDYRAVDPAERIREVTGSRGADSSIEVSGSHEALHQAIRATAYNSRVVCCGFLQGHGAALRLGEEFHHNRIQLISSQTSGVSPRLGHRWSRERLEQTIMRLIAEDRLRVRTLITHVVPATEVGDAFELLDTGTPGTLQVVLDFGEA
jgi:2-desacetyl-2-hydroxyethyl bacteriochlorophyllide A dehydrogenase